MLTDTNVSDVQPALRLPRMVYHTLEVTPDGGGFAAGTGSRVHVWDLQRGVPRVELHEDEPLGRTWLLRFSPDGKRLAALHARGLRVWDVATKRVIHRDKPPEGQRITALAFDDDGRLVTTRSVHPPRGKRMADGQVVVTGLEDGAQGAQPLLIGAHAAVQLSGAAQRVAVAPPGRGVRVFDTSSRKLVRELSIAGTWSLSPRGDWVAYVGVPANAKSTEATVQVVRVSDGKEWVVEGAPSPAGPLAWQPDGGRVAVPVTRADGGHDVVLIDPDTREVLSRAQLGQPPGTYYLSLLPGGHRLLARYRDGGMTFHRTDTGRALGSIGFMDDEQTWLVWTGTGAFDMGGPRADRLIGCRAGFRVLPFALCELEYRKPGLLGEVVGKR